MHLGFVNSLKATPQNQSVILLMDVPLGLFARGTGKSLKSVFMDDRKVSYHPIGGYRNSTTTPAFLKAGTASSLSCFTIFCRVGTS